MVDDDMVQIAWNDCDILLAENEYVGKSSADQSIRMDWAGPFGSTQASDVGS